MEHPSIISDPARLAVLAKVDLLDTPAEEAFDRITRLAHHVLQVPVALCNLVSEDRSFIKSSFGLKPSFAQSREVPLSHCFCQWVIASNGPLVIEDVADSQFRDNPATRELGIRGFIGIPLVIRGQPVVVFNVLDTRPRAWTPEEIDLAQDLAATAAAEIELRLALRERTRAEARERERADAMALTAEAGFAIAHRTYLAEQVMGCAEAIGPRLDAGFLGMWRYDEVRRILTLETKWGCEAPRELTHVRVDSDTSRLALIASELEPWITDSAHLDSSVAVDGWAAREKFVSFAGYPLMTDGRLIGVVALFARKPISASSFRALGSVANMIALAMVRDAARRETLESERRFRALVESSAQVVFRADPTGAIVSASPYWPDASGVMASTNQAWSHVTGENSGPSLGRGWYNSLHPDDRDRVDAAWRNAMATLTPYFMECRVRSRHGTYCWSEVRAVPVFDENGAVREWIGTGVDVTERRRARDTLQLMTDVGGLLAESMEFEATVNNVARMVVGSFCDLCLIDLLNEKGKIVQVAAAAADPAKQSLMREHHGCIRADHPHDHISRAIATGEPQFVPDTDDDWKRRVATSKAHLEYMRKLAFHS